MNRFVRAWRVLRGQEPEPRIDWHQATLHLNADDRQILRSIADSLRNIERKTPNPHIRWVLHDEAEDKS